MFLALAPLVARAAPVDLTVVTFNCLVEISQPKGVKAWKDRRDLCIQMLRTANPDLLGLQEPTAGQVKFFREKLPEYEAVVPENYTDATLFYKKDLFELRRRGHWWLSPTPERFSTGFGNFLPRILVWAELKHRPSGLVLTVFNTHFDNTRPSQERMAELCRRKLKPFEESGQPLIWMGDFNTDQNRGNYKLLTSGGWQDSYKAAKEASPTGQDDNVATIIDGQRRIDHIFYYGPGVAATAWRRLSSPDPSQPYLSDHYAVLAKVRIDVTSNTR